MRTFNLLNLGVWKRVSLAACVLALLWLATAWALS